MTRPRARPKPGRYFIVTCAGGAAVSVPRETRSEAELVRSRNDRSCGDRPHRIVECVPMPRVTVTKDDGSPSVRVNGVCVRSFHDLRLARSWATNLRRALRGK